MSVDKLLFKLAPVLIAGALLAATAGAQTPSCAPEDLACRVALLEARVAALEGRASAAAPRVVYEAPTQTIAARRVCRGTCEAEAEALCRERGFTGGRPEDWERPRSGPLTLTRATCDRPT